MTNLKMNRIEDNIGDSIDDSESPPPWDEVDTVDDTIEELPEEKEREKLARNETKAVSCLRVFFAIFLILSALFISLMVYYYSRRKEIEEFQTHFGVSARKVVESFHDSLTRKLSAADAFSVTITSHALTTGATFPNVTVPHFAIRGSNSRIMSDGIATYWLPLVTKETRRGWESYSAEHQGWIDAAMKEEYMFRKMQDESFHGGRDRNLESAYSFKKRIFDSDEYGKEIETTNQTGPFLPLWQVTPVVPMKGDLNFNMLAHPSALSEDLSFALDSEDVIMSRAIQLKGSKKLFTYSDTSSLYNEFLRAGQYRRSFEQYPEEPITNLIYPVFDQFGQNRSIVGVAMTSIFWSLYFTDTLPENTNGITCVLENTKGQVFTYQVDGNQVTFLGQGDKHDSKYNELEVSVDVKARIENDAGPENWSYTAAQLNADYCRYNLRVYPSITTETRFITNQPVYFAVVVAAVFLFTSLLFLGYDCLVEHRQTIVMNRAVASGAIVSSLFPETVQDRLFEESASNVMTGKQAMDKRGRLKKFLGRGLDGSSSELMKTSMPIADYFSDTTIMFGDLAGFTKWSSSREPQQVFQLLETLYSAFDSIAIRRKVFKVETIGDCYVAVTGLPDPQKQHALIMAKFARDCMAKMNKITRSLSETLGEDTCFLMMRIGLHSGAVTAGVLRGQKARFQLFGDTMNTASRMESTGEKGRIQISQSTANELLALGKKDWMFPREETIVAKGKGEMQTFWLDVPYSGMSTSANSSSTTLS